MRAPRKGTALRAAYDAMKQEFEAAPHPPMREFHPDLVELQAVVDAVLAWERERLVQLLNEILDRQQRYLGTTGEDGSG